MLNNITNKILLENVVELADTFFHIYMKDKTKYLIYSTSIFGVYRFNISKNVNTIEL